jgi:hypothetical protein
MSASYAHQEPDIDRMLESAAHIDHGVDTVLAERHRALDLLAWALEVIKQRGDPSISLDPNYTAAVLAVADAKVRGLI